ncbi:MAG: ATP-binding cassette domain-containing protein [Methanomassiliicoccaceae archaeon]|jgi:ATP-binding cassette subfamily F protein 3|nr:ATP-binding cassette domain-containing protein [Methanomassiliicoccaceae archaeon]
MLLKAESVTKSFGPLKVLLKADLQINRGDSIGLIGVNGSGKSTFMKIFLGELKCDTGELTRNTQKIGYLPQFAESSSQFTVRDVLGRPYGHVENIKRRMREIDGAMASGKDIDWNSVTDEYAKLEKELARSGAEDEALLLATMGKVGLSENLMSRTMDTLSGGERTKVMLARALVQAEGCDVLFLDEPTSHLDVTTVEWLEDHLLESKMTLVVVSHDRYFLDKVATRMTEISFGKTREYKGNYSAFIMKKMIELERMETEYKKYAANKRRQEEIAESLHKDQWFFSTHRTRQKMIERLDEKETPEVSKEITVRIQAAQKSGKNVLTAKNLSVELGGNVIVEKVELDIKKGDKIGIFGPNGAGKSTLVKALLEKIPSKGELWVAPGAKIGYFSQDHGRLDLKMSAEEQILKVIGKERRGEARSLLARMLLTGDRVERPMGTLSGGERARVALTLLLLDETNVLILDEPTNYLDIPSRHAVEEALNDYDGTLIIVTHDRYLLDSVCTKVCELKDKKVTVFNGTYSQMRGRPNTTEIVMDADEYRVVSPFTNWTMNRKFVKGDRVLISPAEMKSYEWALEQGKLKRTGGKQRKKVSVDDE